MLLDEQKILSESLWKDNCIILVEKKTIKQVRINLYIWINTLQTSPFPLFYEKKCIANLYGISISYVKNFCNNYRKRYAKIGKKTISYNKFIQL